MQTGMLKLREVVKSRYWRREDAKVVIDAWRASGATMTEFARRWSLNANRIARWVEQVDGVGSDPAVVFHPVVVVGEPAPRVADEPQFAHPSPWLAEVRREQWTVRVRVGFEAAEMARLLGVVAEVERC